MENVSKEVPFMYLLAGANIFVTRVEYRTLRFWYLQHAQGKVSSRSYNSPN